MARIEFRNIQKSFGDVLVIPGMDLVIEDGEFVALLGPSGCGKSTSLLMLAGIYLPSGGEMLFDGALVNEVEARDRNVGIVFQSYALYPHMSVLQNIIASAPRTPHAWCRFRSFCSGDRPSSPAASSSASPWPVPSSSGRSCCCSTSRSPTSMRPCA
jgi:ABC-type sugar transport system ATPase subunit